LADADRINRYTRIIEFVFFARYEEGADTVMFAREDILAAASTLNIDLPKNLGDVVYSFRYRVPLPDSVNACAPTGKAWMILPRGRSLYAFVACENPVIVPQERMSRIQVPDSTPGIIDMYALSDEQALLARVRYNRLVDIFSGVTCYSLQNHLRTAVSGMGQVETDEVYVGIDERGTHYVFPVQAKGGRDRLSVVQIAQDFAVCGSKFPGLVCRPIATQFMSDAVIAMFEFEKHNGDVSIRNERHYQLVPPDSLSSDGVASYVHGAPGAA